MNAIEPTESSEPSASEPPVPAPPVSAPAQCLLCDEPLAPGALRCSACGLHQQLGPDRPNPFRERAMWVLLGVMAVVYLVVLLVVAVLPPGN